jgi:hypothetical protein
MKRTLKRLVWMVMIALICLSTGQAGLAVGPYTPLEDTYTDFGDKGANYGSATYLQLSASNISVCNPVTYLWFKFQVPNPPQPIGSAVLDVPMDPIYTGGEALPMELLSSADTSWDEDTLTWNNQPALDTVTGVLATSPSVVAPSSAIFQSALLASYLEGKKGELVTLVVRADCSVTGPGAVAPSADRLIASIENTDPQAAEVELTLSSPTAVGLQSFTAKTPVGEISLPIVVMLLGVIVLTFLWRGLRKVSQ